MKRRRWRGGKINPTELFTEQKLANIQSTHLPSYQRVFSPGNVVSCCFFVCLSVCLFVYLSVCLFVCLLVYLPGWSGSKMWQPWPSFLNILVAPIIRLWQLSTNSNPSKIINSTQETKLCLPNPLALLSRYKQSSLHSKIFWQTNATLQGHIPIYIDTRECLQAFKWFQGLRIQKINLTVTEKGAGKA